MIDNNEQIKLSRTKIAIGHLADPHYLEHVGIGLLVVILFFAHVSEKIMVLTPSFVSIGIGVFSFTTKSILLYRAKKANGEKCNVKDFIHILSDTGIAPEIIAGLTALILFVLGAKLSLIIGMGYISMILSAFVCKVIEITTDPSFKAIHVNSSKEEGEKKTYTSETTSLNDDIGCVNNPNLIINKNAIENEHIRYINDPHLIVNKNEIEEVEDNSEIFGTPRSSFSEDNEFKNPVDKDFIDRSNVFKQPFNRELPVHSTKIKLRSALRLFK